MEKENRPVDGDKEKAESIFYEKNKSVSSEEKEANNNEQNNNKSESRNKEINVNENYSLNNFINNEESKEHDPRNKTLDILEESLEKQLKTVEENTKSILTMESKIKEYLKEEEKIFHYKNNLYKNSDGKKNEEEKEKILEEKRNLENSKENVDLSINEENRNEEVIRENDCFKSYNNEKGKEEGCEKNIIDELFYDNYYEQDNEVDIWNNLNYTLVDDVKILNMHEELMNVNNLNVEEETEYKLKKEKMKKHSMKTIEGEEENVLEEYIKNEKGNEKNKPEESGEKINKEDKESEVKQLSLNSIDKSFIQVPLKCILNTFRNIQKELEKNIMIITLFIEKKLTNLSDDMCLDKLNTIIEKLQVLKNKVNESKLLLNKYIKKLVNRLKYIYFEADIQLENLKHDFRFETYENRINWLIDGYLSRYGYFDAQEVFCKRYKLENYSDSDVYKEYLEIINELKNHNTKSALEWCQKYKSQLKKIDSNIESELHLQHVINLIFEKRFFDAIEYIKKTVSQSEGYISSDIKYIITHISLNNSTLSLKTFNERRWKKVIKLFKKVYSEISGILNKPLLELLLKAGISVIKTEHCGKKKSTKCPTCIDELKNTINFLPNIQKTRSFLVCPYTNEVMDENNPPFTTPAGHVYSEKAISLFLKSDDLFECPVTEEKYRIEEFSRLFI